MPLVVRQLQVAGHRPVPVGPPHLPQVHIYKSSQTTSVCRATHQHACAYTISSLQTTRKPATRANTNDQASCACDLRKSGSRSGEQQRDWLAAERPDLRDQRCGLITEHARDVPAFAVAEKDEVAEDVGIDGGAASAEEAAVHIVEL